MGNSKITKRLEWLAKNFDVFEDYENKSRELNNYKFIKPIMASYDNNITQQPLCVIYSNIEFTQKSKKSISISIEVFSKIIQSDPTFNKSYVQWMLNTFVSQIKNLNYKSAIQFITEDLLMASDYIQLFEANKYKTNFIKFCNSSVVLKELKDPTNINQYTSLSMLFDAVDPFMFRNPTELEKAMNKFVKLGQAEMPIRDRKFTVYIPKTIEASVIFNNFANWCTTRPNNSNFNTYTNGNRKPNGSQSSLYIVINNLFFKGESEEIYQIHFETNQLKNKFNKTENCDIYEAVLQNSPSLSKYFYNELIIMAKENKSGLDSNRYIDFLIQFGFCESLFEILDVNTPIIKFTTRKIPKLPDLSKFKELDTIVISNAGLTELDESIGDLEQLELLSLPSNNLKTLPSSIGRLRNLTFLNVSENKITHVPEEIKYLDITNGGSLFRFSINKEHLALGELERIKKLLPSIVF